MSLNIFERVGVSRSPTAAPLLVMGKNPDREKTRTNPKSSKSMIPEPPN